MHVEKGMGMMQGYYTYKKAINLAVAIVFSGISLLVSAQNPPFNAEDLQGSSNIVPVLIIGGGPAGLSAALYAARSRIPTLIIDQQVEVWGGESIVENWPGLFSIKRKDLFAILKSQAKHFGAHILTDSVQSVETNQWPFIVKTVSGRELRALSLVIASGASTFHDDIPGEKEYLGKGVALCSYCDGPQARGKDVIVSGPIAASLHEAANIAPYANSVTIVTQDSEDDTHILKRSKLKNLSNISFLYKTKLVAIRGNETIVTHVDIESLETGKKETRAVSMVFVSSSRKANTAMVPNLPQDEDGYLQTLPGTQEVQPGIFVAGEAYDKKYRQAGVSSGDGIKAGVDAVESIHARGIDERVLELLKPQLFEQLKLSFNSRIRKIKSKNELIPIIQQPNTIVVSLFHMHGCPACRSTIPVFERVAATFKSKQIVFVSAEINEVEGVTDLFNLQSVPTIIIFYEGKIKDRLSGGVTDAQLTEFIGKQKIKRSR